jgi:hypothetical protein
MTEHEWILSKDTGTSSKTIWAVMMGVVTQKTEEGSSYSPPADPADFGRCHRLLERFPHWRARLGEVAQCFPRWIPLVREWDKLTELYINALDPKACAHASREMYDRMKQLEDAGRLLDGWVNTSPGCWRKQAAQTISLGNGISIITH